MSIKNNIHLKKITHLWITVPNTWVSSDECASLLNWDCSLWHNHGSTTKMVNGYLECVHRTAQSMKALLFWSHFSYEGFVELANSVHDTIQDSDYTPHKTSGTFQVGPG